MTVPITSRTDDLGRWGFGKGANLTAAEVDRNFWELKAAIEDLIANPQNPIQIAAFGVSGLGLTITMSNGNTVGPLPLPILVWRWRADWVPNVPYAALDIFSIVGVGIFLVLQDHTSASPFDDARTLGGNPVYQLIIGIPSGSTDGAINNGLASGSSQDWGIIGSPASATADWGEIGTPVTLRIDMGIIGE